MEVISVVVVFALLGAAVWKLRHDGFAKFSPGSRRVSKQIRSLEHHDKLMLTPQHALHLVRVAGRDVVVATYPQGCTLLLRTGIRSTAIHSTPIQRGAGS
jgi:flagellar biogenesis protein FliO